MSQDPFAWASGGQSTQGNYKAGSTTNPNPGVYAGFSPLTASLQQHQPPASSGWVTFGDDGGSAFNGPAVPVAATAATHMPGAPIAAALNGLTVLHAAVPPGTQAAPASAHMAGTLARPPPRSAGPAPAVVGAPTVGAPVNSTQMAAHHLPRPPPMQPNALTTAAPAPSLAASQPAHTLAPTFSPLTNAAATYAFPTFAATHTSGPVTGGASGSLGVAATATTTGISQRLPRPPTSSSAAAATGVNGVVVNPFPGATDQAHIAPQLARPPALNTAAMSAVLSNPFAGTGDAHSSGTNPNTAVAAAASARSLDPFADLSLRPPPIKAPSMVSRRDPAPATASAVAAAATSAAVATTSRAPDGSLVWPNGGADSVPPPGHSTSLGAAAGPGSPDAIALSAPPSATPSSATTPFPTFPTFASLHQQPTAQQHLGTEAKRAVVATAGAGAAPRVAFPAAVAADQASSLLESLALDSKPLVLSGTAAAPHGDGWLQDGAPAWTAPGAPSAAESSTPSKLPPPPSYDEALSMSPGLPSPPPYTEALLMADAPAPPAFEDALSMPNAAASAQPAASHAAAPASAFPAFTPGPHLSAATVSQPSWEAFNDSGATLNTAAAAAVSAPTAGSYKSSAADASVTGLSAFPSQPTLTTTSQGSQHGLARSSTQQSSQQQALPSQICVEVRLPPLKPKDAAWPKRIAAGIGSVFAAPGGDGSTALQWCLRPVQHAHSDDPGKGGRTSSSGGAVQLHFEVPAGADSRRPAEDWDSAPAGALPLPPGASEQVCCMLLDEMGGSLWTGHQDGRITRWSVVPGRAANHEHMWQAHAMGKVVAMALSAWGELWTASSAGSVRAWQYVGGLPGARPPTKLFECRRARLTFGPASRASAPRPHSKARLLAAGPSGRVMWSAGKTGLALWGAYDGEFLGALNPGSGTTGLYGGGPAGVASAGPYAGETGRDIGGMPAQQFDINPATGLEPGLIHRPFVPRASAEGGDEPEGSDPVLGRQVIKGVAAAAKFAAKLGKKIRQNVVGEGAGNSGVGDAGGDGAAAGGPSNAAAAGRGNIKALVSGLDESMFVIYKNGTVEKYTEWGRLLWAQDCGVGLHAAALVGSQLWLGCADGSIRTLLSGRGEPGRRWKAHDFPVTGLAPDLGAASGGLVYSLGEHGAVRAWPAAPPAEAHLAAWRDGLLPALRRHQVAVFAGTWNVNETRPAPASLRTWVSRGAPRAEIVALALQEVEMGTSSVARDAAFSVLYKSALERGNQNAQWWATELAGALAATGGAWARVALRQMSGLLLLVFVRQELLQHCGEVATASVACGVMGVGGNKGAVAVSMSVFRRRVVFVCSHFAAHQERVDERNEHHHKIVRSLHFANTSKSASQQRAGGAAANAAPAWEAADGGSAADVEGEPSTGDDDTGPGMADAALLVWAGDFNYRVNGAYDWVVGRACAGAYGELYALDQCRAEMARGTIFRGLREALPAGHPVFPPTYKFDKGVAITALPTAQGGGSSGGLALPYDSSEKQRVPAWTDRVFFRGSRPGSTDVAEEEVAAGVAGAEDYNAVLEVNDSDHKPVNLLLQVQLPAYKQDQKRRHSLAIAAAVQHAAAPAPQPHGQPPLHLSPAALQLHSRGAPGHIELRNHGTTPLVVHVVAELVTSLPPSAAGLRGPVSAGSAPHSPAQRHPHGAQSPQPHPGLPWPSWLEASPARFVLPECGASSRGSGSGGGEGGGSGGGGPPRRVMLRVLGPPDAPRPGEQVRLRFCARPLFGGRGGGAASAVVSLMP